MSWSMSFFWGKRRGGTRTLRWLRNIHVSSLHIHLLPPLMPNRVKQGLTVPCYLLPIIPLSLAVYDSYFYSPSPFSSHTSLIHGTRSTAFTDGRKWNVEIKKNWRWVASRLQGFKVGHQSFMGRCSKKKTQPQKYFKFLSASKWFKPVSKYTRTFNFYHFVFTDVFLLANQGLYTSIYGQSRLNG